MRIFAGITVDECGLILPQFIDFVSSDYFFFEVIEVLIEFDAIGNVSIFGIVKIILFGGVTELIARIFQFWSYHSYICLRSWTIFILMTYDL